MSIMRLLGFISNNTCDLSQFLNKNKRTLMKNISKQLFKIILDMGNLPDMSLNLSPALFIKLIVSLKLLLNLKTEPLKSTFDLYLN